VHFDIFSNFSADAHKHRFSFKDYGCIRMMSRHDSTFWRRRTTRRGRYLIIYLRYWKLGLNVAITFEIASITFFFHTSNDYETHIAMPIGWSSAKWRVTGAHHCKA
jgi:hypothetical protein